jgi:predicted O-methyltransferase YrrM
MAPRRGPAPTGILADGINAYLERLTGRGPEALASLEKDGLREGWPIVGAAEGMFLHLLARAIRAQRILELGTAIGYSASWFALAVGPKGKVVTVEGDPAAAGQARRNLAALGLADRVEVREGFAQDVLRELRGPFDLVFNDIDKAGYLDVLGPALRLLRVGGLLVTDNVLWQGEVARGGRSSEARTIREYNARIAADRRLVSSLLPLRDGVSVSLKVED